jgi:hypothetical protein
MYSDAVDRQSKPAGLPHSVTPGSLDVCSSPGLFAAYRDLLRQAAPRHPPWTLVRLTILPLHPSLCDPPTGGPAFFKELCRQAFRSRRPLGLTRIELVTSRLSGVRSNQLSYRPVRSQPKKQREERGGVRLLRLRTKDGRYLLERR